MKALLPIVAVFAATLAWGGDKPAAPAATVVTGEVLEAMDVGSYTYLRLKTRNGETWAAVSRAPIRKGAKVEIQNAMVMKDFESKALKKTFPTIVFGNLPGAMGDARVDTAAVTRAQSGSAQPATAVDAPVAKASGANARTVAEIVTQAAQLKDKPVLVRGRVVKYNPGIMDRNWIHLRDGSGSAADNSNDLLVTSRSGTKMGDIVTVKGIVRTDKEFGSGYSYKVIIEDATFQP